MSKIDWKSLNTYFTNVPDEKDKAKKIKAYRAACLGLLDELNSQVTEEHTKKVNFVLATNTIKEFIKEMTEKKKCDIALITSAFKSFNNQIQKIN